MKCCCSKKHNKSQLIRIYINIIEARTLLPSDINGWSDPLCEVSIGNDKFKKIYKTEYCKRTLNPKWNETFIHQYDAEKDSYRSSLRFQVYDHDALFSDLLGAVDVPLAPYSDHKWIEQWHKLRIFNKDGQPLRCRGYIRLKIQCVLPNQYSFLIGDRSDQTNAYDTRSDSYEIQQEKINQISAQSEINAAQARDQQRKQMAYNQNVTEQARRINSQNLIQTNKRSMNKIPQEQKQPLLQEESLVQDQAEEYVAPSNPQYDHIRPFTNPEQQNPPPS